MIETDTEYEEHVIESVDAGPDGWSVDMDCGWSCWVPDHGIEPHAGDAIRLYGRGIGYSIRGITINGQTVYYRTAAEQEAHEEAMLQQHEQRQRDEFEAKWPEFESRIQQLPDVLRVRIAGFRSRNPEFDWKYLEYELFCCEQAVVIAETLDSQEEIHAFNELPYEEQRVRVPRLSDDHSGNTFGTAVTLAYRLAGDEPAKVVRMHGALCPLVGCVDYGCAAAE